MSAPGTGPWLPTWDEARAAWPHHAIRRVIDTDRVTPRFEPVSPLADCAEYADHGRTFILPEKERTDEERDAIARQYPDLPEEAKRPWFPISAKKNKSA